MKRQTQLSVGASLSLGACGPARARVMPARGVVPSALAGRLYESVRAVRIEVFERVHGDGTRADWLVSATPIGDNNVEWPEYVECATGNDPEALIDLVLTDGAFAAGVYLPIDELDEWLDLEAA